MNRTALAVLSGLLALTAPLACSSQSKSTPSAGDQADVATSKVSAPVAVDAKLDGERAHVTLRFDAPATDVQVNVSGADGLSVRSAATPVAGTSFMKAGETSFDVEFTPGPGRSHLVVAVTGSFQGSHMSKVASFAVGTPSAEQQKSSGTTVTGSDGERIKVMPSSDAQ
ncbi:hypothetical protein [Pyxidicoccus trucidator]|uniref:hypothetical protein n=1 Tax=Pyxidicoccus trucidator TaxID=2709662 RepID=UPI0013DCB67A|nr:hypothetical protein [Pyxidicoccus trucidator]